jgi:hypothetical protein
MLRMVPLPRFTGEDEGAAQIAALESPSMLAYVVVTVFSSHRHRSLIRQVGQRGRSAVQT